MSSLFIDSGAIISECKLYRYHLWRIWDKSLPIMVFVMQNPSTADATEDDHTIRKCMGFADKHGYGGISVRNVFALRATNEKELLTHPDPRGPENNNHLLSCREVSMLSKLVVAWGNQLGGSRLRNHYKEASAIVSALNPYCLGTTKSGQPKHPLMVAYAAEIVPWKAV